MKDGRHAPFCWQGIHAMKVLRAHYTGPQRSTAISIYQTLTEIANEHRDRASFEATRKRIAELAGVRVETLDDYVKGLQEIGLIGCEKNKVGKKNLPNTWTLKDPAGVAASDREGGGLTPPGGGVTPLGGGGLITPQELNNQEQQQNPLTPFGDEDLKPATEEGKEKAGAQKVGRESPPASSGVLDGNGEIGGDPITKDSAHLSDGVIRGKMKKDGAHAWQVDRVLKSGNPTAAFYEWKENGRLPDKQGRVHQYKTRAEQNLSDRDAAYEALERMKKKR